MIPKLEKILEVQKNCVGSDPELQRAYELKDGGK